jgi:hypothetical protein
MIQVQKFQYSYLKPLQKGLYTKGAFQLMAWPVRPKSFYLYQWEDLVYISQISRENGPHSNFI